MAHPELGSKILDDVIQLVGDHVKIETQARLEGRNMSMVLAPDRKPLPKAQQAERPAAGVSTDGDEPALEPVAEPASQPATTRSA
jgi:translation initiation factor IF-3